MEKFLVIAQIISAVLLIAVILMQQRGSSLGGLFGGSGDIYRSKRGMEKVLFKATIALSIVFLGSGLAILFA